MTLRSSRKVRQETKRNSTYIHQKYSCNGKITIAHSEDYPSAAARMDISNVHQVSFMCRLYVLALCATYLYVVHVCCMCMQFCLQFSVVRMVCCLCSSIVVMCSTYVCNMYYSKYKVLQFYCSIYTCNYIMSSF